MIGTYYIQLWLCIRVKRLTSENHNDWFGYLTSDDYQPFSHHKKKQKKTKPHEEHICEDFRTYRILYKYNTWVLETKLIEDQEDLNYPNLPYTTLGINYCPRCGVKLS